MSSEPEAAAKIVQVERIVPLQSQTKDLFVSIVSLFMNSNNKTLNP